jgi:hypothetical protein
MNRFILPIQLTTPAPPPSLRNIATRRTALDYLAKGRRNCGVFPGTVSWCQPTL